MVKDFIDLTDFTNGELAEFLDLAEKIKTNPDEYRGSLAGKTLGMIFNKHSTRTRISFQVGIYQLGGMGLYFGPGQLQLDRGEPLSDTGKVLSGYLDGIMIRTFNHQDVRKLAKYASVPVFNGLTDYNHPCQVMADLLTIKEHFGRYEGLKLTYLGDGNNMATSLLFGCVKMGMDISMVSPKDYALAQSVVDKIAPEVSANGVTATFTDNIEEGVAGAHIVYTDVWTSMGQEEEARKRVQDFAGYTVNNRIMAMADNDAIFMHCLPAHRGEEVAPEVIDSKRSVVFQEAENRLHAQKAVMHTLMR